MSFPVMPHMINRQLKRSSSQTSACSLRASACCCCYTEQSDPAPTSFLRTQHATDTAHGISTDFSLLSNSVGVSSQHPAATPRARNICAARKHHRTAVMDHPVSARRRGSVNRQYLRCASRRLPAGGGKVGSGEDRIGFSKETRLFRRNSSHTRPLPYVAA